MALFKIQQAVNMFDQDNEQAGISTLQTLLLQPKLSPFWRVHTLALLAHKVEDWLEAEKYQRQAEMLWRSSRRLLAAGVDDEFDRTLCVNRGLLDQLAVELINEMPDGIRGLLEEVKAKSEQGADGDNDTSDDDDGPDGGLDDSCGEYDADDEADHDGEEQDVETFETGPDDSPDDMSPHTPEEAHLLH